MSLGAGGRHSCRAGLSIRRIERAGFVFLMLLIVPLGTLSCIVVPNLAKRLDEDRVTRRLQVGVSTREDVQRLLGTPIAVSEHLWVHEWRTKKGWIVVGAGYTGGVSAMGVRRYRALTTYDDAGALARLELQAEPAGRGAGVPGGPQPVRMQHLPECRALKACHYVALSKGGRRAAGRWGHGTLRLWDLSTAEVLGTWRSPGLPGPLALDPAGDLVAVGNKRGIVLFAPARNDERFGDVLGVSSRPSAIAFPSRGGWLAVASDRSLALYDLDPWRQRVSLVLPDTITGLEPSPDGSVLAAVTECDGVNMVETASGTVVGTVPLVSPATGATRGAFSPDGARFALNYGSHVVIADVEGPRDGTFQEPEVLLLPFGAGKSGATGLVIGYRSAIAFSPNGDLLAAVSSRGTSVWRLRDHGLLVDYPHQKGLVSDVAFDESGTRLVVAEENAVYEWELPADAGSSRISDRRRSSRRAPAAAAGCPG